MSKTKAKFRPLHSESHARSIVKAVTYRVLIVISIFIITFAQTGRLSDAATITGVTTVTGTIIYYFHERVWSRVRWGRMR